MTVFRSVHVAADGIISSFLHWVQLNWTRLDFRLMTPRSKVTLRGSSIYPLWTKGHPQCNLLIENNRSTRARPRCTRHAGFLPVSCPDLCLPEEVTWASPRSTGWGSVLCLECNKEVHVAQLCLTLCDPMDYTVHGILLARVLEWVAIPFSRGSSQPRDWTWVSCIQADSLPSEPPGKPCAKQSFRLSE